MNRRLKAKNKKEKVYTGEHLGQSIIEYLVVVTILLMAVLAVRGAMGDKFNGVYRNAIRQIP